MRHIFISILLLSGIGLTSCNSWLDVKPKESVNEELLFSREIGFKEALTGVYLQMGEKNMYGKELTYGYIDRLAQFYNDHRQANFYDFASSNNESSLKNIWSGCYNIIANINNLLTWIEKNPEVISTPGYHDLIKGEALGLRAFLHFDLLRMWGPIYKEEPDAPAIIYRSSFNREERELLPASAVLDSIVRDLIQAEKLLKNDPMNISFPVRETEDFEDKFLKKRFKRMNLYAVKALMARVYLWKGDKENAVKYASEVIHAQDQMTSRFRLVTDNSSDRIYSTEIIFSLSIDQFDQQVSSDFSFSNAQCYIDDLARYRELFNTDTDGVNDMRYREGQGFEVTQFNACTRKYIQTGLYSEVLKNTLPLIRLPEMYYILAECSDDLSKAAYWISEVSITRGMDGMAPFQDEKEKMERLSIEYRKEFYGEGQYWFFLKRNFFKTFVSWITQEFEKENYRFAIPTDEKLLGKIN